MEGDALVPRLIHFVAQKSEGAGEPTEWHQQPLKQRPRPFLGLPPRLLHPLEWPRCLRARGVVRGEPPRVPTRLRPHLQ